VTREYAQLKSDLRQIMGNEAVKSLMVTDLDGVVLAYLERKIFAGVVIQNFTANSVDISRSITGQYSIEKQGDVSILWYRVNPSIPLGWIIMEIFQN
jgi:hypothetical protein